MLKNSSKSYFRKETNSAFLNFNWPWSPFPQLHIHFHSLRTSNKIPWNYCYKEHIFSKTGKLHGVAKGWTGLSDRTTTTQLGGEGKRSRTMDWEKKELTPLWIVTDGRHIRKDTSACGLVSFSVKWQDHLII